MFRRKASRFESGARHQILLGEIRRAGRTLPPGPEALVGVAPRPAGKASGRDPVGALRYGWPREARRWPMATAAASAASWGRGSLRPRSTITIFPTCPLSAHP